jgi:cysteine protease ATG4
MVDTTTPPTGTERMYYPRIRRMWQQIWDVENVNGDHEHEIVCLGQRYDPRVAVEGEDVDGQTVASDGLSLLWPQEFLEDVGSRVWLTYRKNFPLIPKAKNGPSTVSISGVLRGSGIEFNGFTTDVGWGCMIRTAQSLLANALVLLRFGRRWRRDSVAEEVNVIRLFADEPGAPLSLHNFVRHGETHCGKRPGEWFGPSAAASSIKALCEAHCDDLRVYISAGSDVYENEMRHVAVDAAGRFRPTLILLGIRLGIDAVNPVYWDTLTEFLAFPQAVGIAGGRPSSSHYFFGYQHDSLFYLDPHQWQPALRLDGLDADALESVHTTRIRSIHLSEMDPSMLVGFLVRDEADWQMWKQRVVEGTTRKIVTVSKEPPQLNARSSVSLASDDEESEFIDVAHDTTRQDDEDDEEEMPVMINSSSAILGASGSTGDEYTPVMVDDNASSIDEPVNLSFHDASSSSYTPQPDEDWEMMKRTFSKD